MIDTFSIHLVIIQLLAVVDGYGDHYFNQNERLLQELNSEDSNDYEVFLGVDAGMIMVFFKTVSYTK